MGSDPLPHMPKKILIVEDNPLNLKLLQDLLEYHRYIIFSTTRGEEAVAMARHHRPNLILMDMQLPDITGMEAARRLKADEYTRMIPIVAVTAFAMSGDRTRILESGCDDYLAKPLNVTEFLRLVASYVNRQDRD